MASAQTIGTLTPVKLEPYIDPQNARTLAGEFAASQTIVRGTILGQLTSSSKWKVYTDANTDGSGVAAGICVYDIVVDSNGYIVYGPSGSTSSVVSGNEKTAPIYWKGTFLETDLTGLDAAAVTDMKARELGVGTLKCLVLS